ncbi:Alpha/Beta hydrolase protein [Pseudomassariella vexata]|uniref:Carboxylic ester hydrolase n=1 Tax=Pseudomassariella vexata TaxID=1141098 RepID=A0A1Y2E0L2_9PEZI|nr:Alpha/Beta hydrolase protein [Pseudomassariella vexata]ORY64405.1 Alpha/Beta hydrolase protein [Pseudomassariella vexata]
MKIKIPWYSKYSGYEKLKALPKSQTRCAVFAVSCIGAVIILAILTWLFDSGYIHRGGLNLTPTASVRLPQGTYKGEVQSKSADFPRAIEAYRGIPYAQTTGGENRFRPSRPLSSERKPDVVYSAIDYGHICPQLTLGSNQDEDCLNANVFRPYFGDDETANAEDMAKLGGKGQLLPVVIYVHGGGFNGGSGSERNMASFVAWADSPLIGISFNYRVGALGFLPSGLSEKAGLLNLGLKDQQLLFAWVQKNVKNFGGDPDNVTIMGLSAGAHSVGHHMISYSPANKLTSDSVPFQKAIMESGSAMSRAVLVPTHPLHETQFREFLLRCNLQDTPDEEIFDQLRSLPIRRIVAASNFIYRKYYYDLRWPFQPVIDGPRGIIPDLPSRSWDKGNVLRIPILTGFDTNEGSRFVAQAASNNTPLRKLMSNIIPGLNETALDIMETLYPNITTPEGTALYITQRPAGLGKQFWRLDDAYAHYAYICPVFQTAHYATTSTSEAPVYVYHFAARSATYSSADHSDEAPLVAHDMSKIQGYPGLIAAADSMVRAWARFAAFGDPNPISSGNASLTWTRYFSPFGTSNGDEGGTTAERAQVALFAHGNDEGMDSRGRHSFGTPAQMIDMSQREMDECMFWWDNILYSEGYGNGSLAIPAGNGSGATTC